MTAPKTPTYRVECAVCHAEPGERCTTTDGALRQWAHDKRVIDANHAQPELETP
jgi:hypothetical protein